MFDPPPAEVTVVVVTFFAVVVGLVFFVVVPLFVLAAEAAVGFVTVDVPFPAAFVFVMILFFVAVTCGTFLDT